ncbi:MAG TPA: hypothetical protein VHB48_03740 [Chitinophagaceae bacterium]|nr:hypothetical protein [Chitinophagaceae bacterium]
MKINVLKKVLLLWVLLAAAFTGFAQDIPKTIPPFNMVLSDGATYYNADSVKKDKPLMIVYFDPECQHCQQFTQLLTKNIKKFSATQIVMICAAPGLPPLKKFVSDFKLNTYPNIKAGTEGMYHATMNFYKVDVTPFTALYDKNGALLAYYRTVPQIQTLVKQLSK